MTFNCDTNEVKNESCYYWDVETDDKIGVLFYQNYYSGCPLHINLNPNKKCHSALYCDVDNEDIPVDEEEIKIPVGAFEEVHILLNLEVNITPSQWL